LTPELAAFERAAVGQVYRLPDGRLVLVGANGKASCP
jgi:hypothetical protein